MSESDLDQYTTKNAPSLVDSVIQDMDIELSDMSMDSQVSESSMIVKVHFLDDFRTRVICGSDLSVGELKNIVCLRLRPPLFHSDMFRFYFESHNDLTQEVEQIWLEEDQSLKSQSVSNDTILYFTNREYILPSDILSPLGPAEDITRSPPPHEQGDDFMDEDDYVPPLCHDTSAVSLIQASVKRQIICGELPADDAMALRLAALDLMAEFGEFNSELHVMGFLDRIAPSRYLPCDLVSLHPPAYWQKRALEHWAGMPLLGRHAARLAYIGSAAQLPRFGFSWWGARRLAEGEDTHGERVEVGLAIDGLMFTTEAPQRKPVMFIPWESITEMDVGMSQVRFGIDVSTFEGSSVAVPPESFQITSSPSTVAGLAASGALLRVAAASEREHPIYFPAPPRAPLARGRSHAFRAGYIAAARAAHLAPSRPLLMSIDSCCDLGRPLTTLDLRNMDAKQINAVQEGLLAALPSPTQTHTCWGIEYTVGTGTSESPFAPASPPPPGDDLRPTHILVGGQHARGAAYFAALSSFLATPPLPACVDRLELREADMGQHGDGIGRAAASLPHLRALTLDWCELRDRGLASLLTALRDGGRALQELSLAHNRLGDASTGPIGAFVAGNPDLRCLSIAHNAAIGVKGLSTLAETLRSPSLDHLDLSGLQLRKCESVVARLVNSVPSLLILSLADTGCVPDLALAELAAHSPCGGDGAPVMVRLDLSGLPLGDGGMEACLRAMMGGERVLRVQELSMARCGAQLGSVRLLELLRIGVKAGLKRVDLSGQGGSNKGALLGLLAENDEIEAIFV
eukprot:gnl/Dysnectes_brevis/3425_a4323_445.p1 GENE.gnl/Dysnectes_brevis/3425_a4323_445~~gnl/Dysnectes_brevis/3425_a4323_445.p1  ORF type:complete len:800 (-),score=148.26 gnl/Dysnectes_brevis/3425_a4323_445:53-2452(-)